MLKLNPDTFSARNLYQGIAAGLAAFFLWMAFFSWFGFAWDNQENRCLPWRMAFLYPVGSDPIERGDYVQFIALGQNFLGRINGQSAGKMVAGIPGDHVQIIDGRVYLNHTRLNDLETHTTNILSRDIGSFDTEYTLGADEYFVVGTMPHSFDSRYWGQIKRSQIQHRLAGIF